MNIKTAVNVIAEDATTHAYATHKTAEAIMEALAHAHRTHQASFWRAIAKLIPMYADADSDLRNEAAVQWCKDVCRTLPPAAIPFL